MSEMFYDHKDIEPKWQKAWKDADLHTTSDKVEGKENEYLMVEFPYPSGNLHIGHWYAFALPDVYARYQRMNGKNVLYPFGFDSFGLPAENAAIKRGLDPRKWTYENMDYMRNQLESMGASFDWSREIKTSDPEYYKWNQWIFTKFFENDIAYQAQVQANWCESCKTVLANEQVEAGKCERCGNPVSKKSMRSWNLRITDFADDLIDDLDDLDWPEHIKDGQRNWIGRSEGSLIPFSVTEPEMFDVNTGPGGDAYREGSEIVDRDNVVVIIEHPEKDEFLCARWKQVDWQGFVTGGIGGDTPEQTAIEEVREETGYQNPEIVKVYEQSSHGLFWHVVKEQNRRANYRIVHVKLKDLEYVEPDSVEQDIAEFVWVPRDEVSSFLKREDMRYPWRVVNGQDITDINVFTTRADTLFGATYLVLAPEHPMVGDYVGMCENKSEVENYIEKTKLKSERERQENREKTGVQLKGITATNPATGESIPVWIADYVLAGYGTGAVMAVPAHDQRDFDFAQKFDLPIKQVIEGESTDQAQSKKGSLINSDSFSGLHSDEAIKAITESVGGELTNTYRLRDWSVSRQRYWGCPIPIVYDPQGQAHAVPLEHLPWTLPDDVDHTPDGTAPLARSEELKKRTVDIFGQGWTPEVETFDTFVDSSWYFLRYLDPHNDHAFADTEKMKNWMPVDLYMGGAEHTTMHLLYSRFWIKAMHKIGLVDFSEPFKTRINRGLILGPDGEKMSKSKGNVIDPDKQVELLGADTVRAYLAFLGPYTGGNYPWNPDSIAGVRRFLERVWKLQSKVDQKSPESLTKSLHKTIKKVGSDYSEFKFNTAISAMMTFVNDAEKSESISFDDYEKLLIILAPLAPHICEELWHKTGNDGFVVSQQWPSYDEKMLVDDTVEIGVQVNGKMRGSITVATDASEAAAMDAARDQEGIAKWIEGEPKKIIYIPGKILNIII